MRAGGMTDEKPTTKQAKVPALDDRRLAFAELAPFAGQLDPHALVAMTGDGRPTVRANAALGLAVVGHATPELCTLLRDSDVHAALAAAHAIAKLGTKTRPFVPQVVASLDGAQPEVNQVVV